MNDFFRNSAGAKIYKEPYKHIQLNYLDEGTVYTVLSTGLLKSQSGNDIMPLVTVETKNGPIAYLLPEALSEWVMALMAESQKVPNLLPCKIQFGESEGIIYAHML